MSGNSAPVNQQLDQLQTQVDRVLEQIGRVFAASNRGPKTSPAAQVTRLRQIFPAAFSGFHDALDSLEDQLQTAQRTIRRDYSCWRNQRGLAVSSNANHALAADMEPVSRPLDEDIEMSDAKFDVARDNDAEMSDAEATIEARNPPNETAAADDQIEINATQAPDPPTESQAQEARDPVDETTDSKDGAALHIDTQTDRAATDAEAPLPNDEEKPPDTGTFSNNADLDSLFNDPISAGGVDDDPAAPTDFDPTGDFDFGAFNASLGEEHAREDGDHANVNDDNDNIDALIPGLQDYANNAQSEHEPDFEALFAGGAEAGLPMSSGGGGDGDGEHPPHDSTFDDLMDFADFNAGDWMGADGQAEG